MGRPSDATRHKFQEILKQANAYERFRGILCAKRTKDETFLKAFELAHERAFGKSPQYLEMDVNDVTNRPTAEQLSIALRSLNGDSEGAGVDPGK
jgi:hypothetical protein